VPVLSNPKHERFAQELAKGKTQNEAYAEAGYAPSEPNASRLTSNDKVRARVTELQERAAVRTEITVASITDRLLAIAKKGEGTTEAPMLAVARASLMDAAKLNGLVIEKSETALTLHDVSSEPESSEAEWTAKHGK
jgi:phage terminase small subunit